MLAEYTTFKVESLSESQQKQLSKLLSTYKPEELENGSLELLNWLNKNLFGNLVGASVMLVPLRHAVNSQSSVVQRPLIPAKVFNVLAGDNGLLKGGGLIQPLLFGSLDEEESVLTNEGGRHRLTAILFIYNAFGFSPDEIMNVSVPAFIIRADSRRVISDNVSRGATKFEQVGIRVSQNEINPNDASEVITAYVEGKLDGTPASQFSDMVRLVFISITNENTAGLTEETRGAVGTSFVAKFKSQYPKESKFALRQVDFISTLLQFAADNLEGAVNYCKAGGITILARAAATMGGWLVSEFKRQNVKIPLAPVKVAEPKPVKEVKEKKATAPKAPKNGEVKTTKVDPATLNEEVKPPAPATRARKKTAATA